MKKISLVLLLFTAYCLTHTAYCYAANYFVSPQGSNTNPGTEAQPWATIQKAADTIIAGDTANILAGDYHSQRINLTKSGTAQNPITFRAQGQVITKGFKLTANYLVIDGFEIADTDYARWNTSLSAGIYIKGANNLIEHNYIHDAALYGIDLFGPPSDPLTTHDNFIRYNRIYHNEMVGINVAGRNNLIENNEIEGSVQCLPSLTAVEDIAADNPNHTSCPNYPVVNSLDADYMRFFGQGHTIRNNNLHGISINPPETVNPHIDCFQTWSGTYYETAQNILFEQNYCENVNQGMYVFMLAGGANNLTIKNNFFWAYGGINTDTTGQHHLYVYHNLFRNNLAFKEYAVAIGFNNAPYSVAKNNIFYDQGYHTITAIGDTIGQEIDYNLAFNSDGSKPDCLRVGDYSCANPAPPHDLWQVNPLFTSDFHLKSNSPACAGGEAGTYIGASPCTFDYLDFQTFLLHFTSIFDFNSLVRGLFQ